MLQMIRNKKAVILCILFFVFAILLLTSCTVTDEGSRGESEGADMLLELTPKPTLEPTPEPTAEPTPRPTPDPTPEPTVGSISEVEGDDANASEFAYVLNTSTQKIHRPSCKSVAKIKAENYATTDKSLDELLSEGYTKCGNCW